ncbi:MAG: TIGR03749 family integrating conjugative element protein [Pseudomonadota bacterium]
MRSLLTVLMLSLIGTSTVNADTTLPWRGEPLSLQIPVGVERVIRFEAKKMQVGIPRDLAGIASAESNNGFVYLRAARPFEQKRFRFRDKDTGRIYAIDVSAREGSAFQPVHIVDDMNEPSVPNNPGTDITTQTDPTWSALADTISVAADGEDTDASTAPPDIAPVTHPYTTLTRYAMQRLYAPERLITPLDDLVTVNVSSEVLNALVPGAHVSAQVLGQWRNVDHLVTAIVLHNQGDHVVHLDPRAMRGKQFWLTAALIQDWLSPINQPGERTGLVVISHQQWMDYPWLKR